MSRFPVRPLPPSAGLYARLEELFRRAATQPATSLASGFVNPERHGEKDLWRPLGELPPHLIEGGLMNGAARFCVFGGRAWIGIRGSHFTDRERQKLAHTKQTLTITLNGVESFEVSYVFDGRARWSFFPAALPDGFAARDVHAVEIERDGKLLLSAFASEDADARNYQSNVWLINSNGRLSGSVHGAASDVPVGLSIDGKSEWTFTNPGTDPAKRPFEFNLAPWCADGALVCASVFNPATDRKAQRSPLGAFACDGRHFLFADPHISGNAFRAVLMFWKDGRRRPLKLAAAGATVEVNLQDLPSSRFDGGNNSFSMDLGVVGAGGVAILDDDGAEIGKLPPLPQILEFTRQISTSRDELYQRLEFLFGAEHDNAALLEEMRAAWTSGDLEQTRRSLLMAAARAIGRKELEELFTAAGALQLK